MKYIFRNVIQKIGDNAWNNLSAQYPYPSNECPVDQASKFRFGIMAALQTPIVAIRAAVAVDMDLPPEIDFRTWY